MARTYFKITTTSDKGIYRDQHKSKEAMRPKVSGWSGSDDYFIELTSDSSYEYTVEPIINDDGWKSGIKLHFKRKKHETQSTILDT